LHVGENPDFLATDAHNAWVIDDNQSRVIKISPDSDKPLLIIQVPGACTAPVVGFDAVWVMSCSEKSLYKIDHTNGAILAKIPTGISDKNGEMSLATGDGSVWLLSDSTGILTRVNPETNAVIKRISVAPHSYCAAFGNGSIWVTNYINNSVQKINLETNSVIATIPVGLHPRFITASEHGVWTLNQGDGTVSKIDPTSDKVVATINVKAIGPGGDITSDSKNVWVISTNTERPVQVINSVSNKIETIYQQTPADKKIFKVDGAARISANFIWISGYYSKTVWILKK
jgi:YVTN family beta-propeller protein